VRYVFTLIPDVYFDFLFGGAFLAIFENSRLTKRAIDALTPRAKPFIAFDADTKGFGCRVQPSGLKTFVLEHRPGAGGRSSP
jgi:hypothetical protein